MAPPPERGDELVDVLVLGPDVDEQILERGDRSDDRGGGRGAGGQRVRLAEGGVDLV